MAFVVDEQNAGRYWPAIPDWLICELKVLADSLASEKTFCPECGEDVTGCNVVTTEVEWPDGCHNREKWMSHVWYHLPMSVLAQACIHAKEAKNEPRYLPFMEPEGWTPKADFTCWICGVKLPHHHTQAEIDAARKTLEVFRENVWDDLCQPRPAQVEE